MNIFNFLIEQVSRLEATEGYKKYSLQYKNRIFTLRKGDMDADSVATVYLDKDCELNYELTEIEEVPCDCFIQKEMYFSDVLDHPSNIFVKDLLDILSRDCRCSGDCTMENGCGLMQALSSLKSSLNWQQNWAGELLEEAEECVSNWIYGM